MPTHEKPKLCCTRDYSIFESHQYQRPRHEDRRLIASMKKHGFMPSSPIQCVRNGSNRLKIVRGHHRLDCARRLSLPVWYVIDASNENIFDLEGTTFQRWSVADFLYARTQAGEQDFKALSEFRKRHNLTIGAAASLLGGETAGSTNKMHQIKDGTYKVANDLTHARLVVKVVDFCRERGIDFATSSAFVAALSSIARVHEFDANLFMHKIALHGSQLRKCSTKEQYLDEIEALYNYAIRKRVPLAFRARETARERCPIKTDTK